MDTSLTVPPRRDRAGPGPFRVVYLSARSGGGHHGTARALTAWLERVVNRPVEAEIVDVYGSKLTALPWMARVRAKSDVIWGGFIGVTSHPLVLRSVRTLMRPVVLRRLRRAVRRRPDLLVATHFVGAQCIDRLAREFAPRPPTLAVVTDYAPHPAWLGGADLTVVSREPGLALAREGGLSADRLLPVPLLPCAPRTSLDPSVARSVGGPWRLCAVMGADGTSAGRLRRVLAALDRINGAERFHVSVLCGYNDALRAALSANAWKLRRVRVEAMGHVDDVPRRLAAADAALVRASPLVLTEALGAGRPVFAFDWHHHEAAGARLLEAWQVGRAQRSADRLADELSTLTRDADAWRRLEARALAQSREAFGADTLREILGRLGLAKEARLPS